MISITEKILIIKNKKKITLTAIANNIGWSSANLGNKMERDNYTLRDIESIAEALNCTLKIELIDNDTNEIY